MASILKAANRQSQQIATGLRVTRSIYGSAIAVPYGRVRMAPQLIWAGNFKSSPAGGKSAKGKKGGQTQYSMDADLLLGFGPIQTVGALWVDNEFHAGAISSQTFTGAGPASTFNFTVTNNANAFWAVIGVVVQQAFSVSYSDYGGPSVALSGTTLLPLYNQAFPAPNSGDWQYAGIPYATYNTSFASPNVTVVFPSAVSGITVIVYYKESQTIDGCPTAPLTFKSLEFESQLGSGGEGAPQVYSDFSGVGAPDLNLGAVNVMPGFSFEAFGLYSYGRTGDCNPADIAADIICSGNKLIGWGGSFPPPVWQHGLNLTSLVSPDATGGVGSTGPYNPAYSRYGGILDDEPNLWGPAYSGGSNPGLNLLRNFCQAYGIFLSYPMDSQQSAAQYLDDLLAITATAGCWDGAQLKFIPYCEVSNFGNGASYVATTAAGPILSFNDADYIQKDAKGNPKPPVEITRQRAKDNYNSLTISFADRLSGADTGTTPPNEGGYDSNTVIVTDQADVTVQGPMPGTTLDYQWIKDKNMAANVGWMIMRRNLLVERRTYKWSASARFGLLSLMDLVTLVEPSLPGGTADVRITKITENPDWSLDFEAEPFIYGACVPVIPAVTPAASVGVLPGNQGLLPGSVNAPIIFEKVPAMPPLTGKPQIAFCVSGASPNYGGCTIWLSTDGGSTYEPVGKTGKNTMGAVYSSNFPSHADPDAADTLHVDLTQSLGTLSSFTTTQRDLFQSLCYLAGGGTVVVNGQTLTIPYELVAYATATLAAANKYSLPPTLRRGVYGTPIATHNIGSAFSFLEDGNVFFLEMLQAWIGVTLHFKFTAFNQFGGNEESLASVTDYTFTPSGAVGWTFTAATAPTGNQPFPTGGQNPSAAAANDLYFYLPGTYASGQVLFKAKPSRSITIPAGMTGTNSECDAAPTGSIVVTINKNGSPVGTVNFAASSTTPTFTFASAVTFNGTTDEISYVAPSTADATFAGLVLDIWATRSN